MSAVWGMESIREEWDEAFEERMRVWEWEARFERSARENWEEWVVSGSDSYKKKLEKRKRWTRGVTCRENRWLGYVRFREMKERQNMEREDVRLWVGVVCCVGTWRGVGCRWGRGWVGAWLG